MAKRDKLPTLQPVDGAVWCGVDLSNDPLIFKIEADSILDPITLGTPITIMTDETHKENPPVPMLSSPPTLQKEPSDQGLARPIRGVEAQSEHIQYLRSSEDVENDLLDQEKKDNDIDPKELEIIENSDDEITPYINFLSNLQPTNAL